LEIWDGKESNVPAAQRALSHRAKCCREARGGRYYKAMETHGSA
jgi:fructose-bisphosphate aldolase class I